MDKVQKGRFITFEGGEGSGKSTQSKLLVEAINNANLGFNAIWTREPGGTKVAEILREVILSGNIKQFGAKVETLLFYAARMDHVDNLIKPALEQGDWVICDRFYDSTTAYQMAASGVDKIWLEALRLICLEDFKPDLTFLIDLDYETAQHRVKHRSRLKQDEKSPHPTDRFEEEGKIFHEKVLQAFRDIASADWERCYTIDGNQDISAIQGMIFSIIENKFDLDRVKHDE